MPNAGQNLHLSIWQQCRHLLTTQLPAYRIPAAS